MNIRKALIIGSIGLATVIGCNRENTRAIPKPSYTQIAVVPQYAQGAGDLAIGDIDADGDLDIIVGSQPVSESTFDLYKLMNESGSYRKEFIGNVEQYAKGDGSVALGDVDNDGDLDLVVGSQPRAESTFIVYQLMNDGKGNFR